MQGRFTKESSMRAKVIRKKWVKKKAPGLKWNGEESKAKREFIDGVM